MIRKIAILLIVVIHFLTPYSINKLNVDCQCGCREWPCYCCRGVENSCDEASVRACRCDIDDDPYVQSPAVIARHLRIRLHLDRMGHVVHSNNGFTLPGYKEPPMKPPPTS